MVPYIFKQKKKSFDHNVTVGTLSTHMIGVDEILLEYLKMNIISFKGDWFSFPFFTHPGLYLSPPNSLLLGILVLSIQKSYLSISRGEKEKEKGGEEGGL